MQLNPEQHYFEEYYATYSDAPTESLDKLSSQKILALWMEFEQHAERETRLGLLQKISIMFRFNRNALKLFLLSPELVIPYLQSQFYFLKRRELEAEKAGAEPQSWSTMLLMRRWTSLPRSPCGCSGQSWQHGTIGRVTGSVLKRMISARSPQCLHASTRWYSARPIPLKEP